jgi:2-haloacid dehalogenase
MSIEAVIFDLGGVVIDWDPAYLYRHIFDGDHAGVDFFLSEICTPEWNLQQDAGRSLDDATTALVRRHPQWEPEIRAYYDRWTDMIAGLIPGTSELMHELSAAGIPLFALSNFSRENFSRIEGQFPAMNLFDEIFLSADHRCTKPDPRFYRIALEAIPHAPEALAFVDDRPENVHAARQQGMASLVFTDARTLRDNLRALGLPLSDQW